MILNICDSADTLKIINIIVKIIKIIRIVVPIILMVSLMIDLIRSLLSKENDALNKTLSICLRKIVLAIIIFLLPNIVSLITDVIGYNEYKQCIDLTNIVDTTNEYELKSVKLINKYKETKEEKDYIKAKKYINSIENEDIKDKYINKLEKAHKEINKKK